MFKKIWVAENTPPPHFFSTCWAINYFRCRTLAVTCTWASYSYLSLIFRQPFYPSTSVIGLVVRKPSYSHAPSQVMYRGRLFIYCAWDKLKEAPPASFGKAGIGFFSFVSSWFANSWELKIIHSWLLFREWTKSCLWNCETSHSSVVREFVKTKNMVHEFVNRTPPPGGLFKGWIFFRNMAAWGVRKKCHPSSGYSDKKNEPYPVGNIPGEIILQYFIFVLQNRAFHRTIIE